MLKHLSKTFLISLISWSLLTVQTGVVFAAVTQTEGEMITDSKGNITTKTNYHFEKISDSDMLASITMLAGGMITARMYASYKPITPDVMVAAAAGAAFVAGEVLSNVKFKGKIDEMTIAVERKNDQTINEEQIQRLQDLKASYEEARSTTKTKKTLQLAAAVAFTAAALTSTYIAVMEATQVGVCRTTIAAAKVKLEACAASSVTVNPDAPLCKTCSAAITKYNFAFNKYNLSRMPPGLSMFQDKKTDADQTYLLNPVNYCSGMGTTVVPAVSLSMGSGCKPAIVLEKANEVVALKGPVKITSTTSFIKDFLNAPLTTSLNESSYFEKILNIFFPRAEAGWLPLLGLGASTAAAFFLITGTMATELDTLLFVPKNRAIAFGLLAGLSYMASKSSDNVVGKIDENIKRIDIILADLEKMGKGVKTVNIKKQAVTSVAYTPTTIAGAALAEKTPCATSEASSNCTTLTSQLPSSSGFANLPASLQELATQAVTIGDGVSGTSNISGSTLAAADSLGSKQAAIAQGLKKAEDQLQKISKDKFTPEQRQNDLLKSIGAKIKKDLEKKGMTATGFMGSIGATVIDSTLPGNKIVDDTFKAKAPNGSAAAIDISAPAGEAFKLDFKNESTGIALNEPASSGKTPEYEFNESSIHEEAGPSIFELISNRYIRSGYPKLLEVEPSKK